MKSQEIGVFFSATQKLVMNNDPTLAEALAVRRAFKYKMDLHLQTVIFHSDALVMVDNINLIYSITVLEPIEIHCRIMLKQYYVASLLFVSRNCNQEANLLVGMGHNYRIQNLD